MFTVSVAISCGKVAHQLVRDIVSHGSRASFSVFACVPWLLTRCLDDDKLRKVTDVGSYGYGTTMTDTTSELKGRGRDNEWPDWSFTMRAEVSVMSDDLACVLERAGSLTTTVTIETLEQASLGITTYVGQAHYHLAITCKGPALGIVKAVERNDGVEMYEPDAGPRLHNMMTRIHQLGDFLGNSRWF